MRIKDILEGIVSTTLISEKEKGQVGNEITFAEAIEVHRAWKQRLLDSLDDNVARVVPEDVCRDDACTLGRWLHGSGKDRYGGFDSFNDLIAVHAEFHKMACKVVELQRDGRRADAQKLLAQDFAYSSRDIVRRLHHLATVFEQDPVSRSRNI